MKKLFAAGIVYICLLIVIIGGMYKAGQKGASKAISDEKTAVAEDSKKNQKKEMLKDVVVKGNISENLTPFHYITTADKCILDKCYATPLKSGETKNICDMKYTYDKRNRTTVYELKLKNNMTAASGQVLRADDLIFNYYLRADTGYSGENDLKNVPVVGMKQYRYGTKNIKVMNKKIEYQLKHPNRKMKQLIKKEIIAKVLNDEYKWVCSLYHNHIYNYITGKYKKTKDLFAYFFAYQTGYKTKNKTVKRVINEIIRSYGYDYNKLSKITGKSYKRQAEDLALCVIQSGKNFHYTTKNISGISMKDDKTITITVRGKHTDKIAEKLFHIYIVTLSQWGDMNFYDGKEKFGFERGKADEVLKGKEPQKSETGNYEIAKRERENCTLKQR